MDEGGDTGGAPEGGGDASAPTPNTTGTSPVGVPAPGEGSAAAPADKPPEAPAAKYKFTRGGEDREMTGAELSALASDDWRHELKVNGSVERPSLKDMEQYYQLGLTAQQKMSEAADMRKKLDTDRQGWIKDPLAFFGAAGIDPDQWANQQLMNWQELEQLKGTDPNAWHQELERRRLERDGHKTAWEAKQTEARSVQEAAQKRGQDFNAAMPTALEGVGLAASKSVAGVVRMIMQDAQRAGHDISPEQAAMFARDQYRRDQRSQFSGMDGKDILDWLGEDVTASIRKAEVARVKGKEKGDAPNANPEAAKPRTRKPADAKRPTISEVLGGMGDGR